MARKTITDLSLILDELVHEKSTCNDQRPVNYHAAPASDKPRCQRCAVLKALSDPEYAKDVEVVAYVNYDITLHF